MTDPTMGNRDRPTAACSPLAPCALGLVALVVGCSASPSAPLRSAATVELPRGSELQLPPEGYEAIHVPDVPLPDPAAGQPISLDAILAYADRHAPVLMIARERVGLGDAAVASAQPLLPDNPSVSVGAGPRFTDDGTFTDLTASVSQRLEIAGERGLRLRAAERTRQRLEAELDEARWGVHREVHAAFHRALVARERLAVAERLLGFQERVLDIARRRLQAGDIGQLPVRLAEAELSGARVARIAAEQGYLRARLELAAQAGWPARHPPEPAGELDAPRDPPSVEALIEVARTHQPRLRTLHAARAEAVAGAQAAERDSWPEPTIAIQATREGAPSGSEETVLLGAVSIPVPLFQRNQAARATARAETRIADAERAALQSQLLVAIADDRVAVAAAAARVRIYAGEILPSFEENLRLIQRAFELGEIDFTEVSVARERFLRTQMEALEAYVEYFEAVADLEASIGTDLWPEERHEHSANGEAAP